MQEINFAIEIITWYKNNQRNLPWRNTKDPYLIWLSEIILQQTKVDQGLPYYNKLSKYFPTVFDLANAKEEKVLKLWQGLGYYSRARNLHQSAKFIVNELDGIFPDNYQGIIKLKGVGEYTASAVSSFAFNEKKAVVDGNVYRVLSRFFGVSTPIDSKKGKKEINGKANEVLPLKHVPTYNQAIMDFGALQCKPKKPKCNDCPLSESCYAKTNNQIHLFPVKSNKIKIKKRCFNYLVLTNETHIYIEKRIQNDIWKNLYQFPMIECESDNFNPFNYINRKAQLINKSNVKHQLSHQKISAIFWHFDINNTTTNIKSKAIKLNQLHKYPVPKIVENYIKEHITVEVY